MSPLELMRARGYIPFRMKIGDDDDTVPDAITTRDLSQIIPQI
jgi:hypothetical protein